MSGGTSVGAGNQRGFGLLLVVVVLAVLGFLSLIAVGIARREFRSATDVGFAAAAFEAAESGLAAAASVAEGFGSAPLLVPQSGPAVLRERTRFATTIIRLNGSVVVLESTGERLNARGDVLARRVLGLAGKIVPAHGAVPAGFRPLHSRGWTQLYR